MEDECIWCGGEHHDDTVPELNMAWDRRWHYDHDEDDHEAAV